MTEETHQPASWPVLKERRDAAHEALKLIARGNPAGGRPMAAEAARQLARGVLIGAGVKW